MKVAWHMLLHLLGLACVAADVLIIGSLGQFDLTWTGWLAIAFCWWLAIGVAMGWRRLVGQPLSLMIIGFYLVAVMALLGFGFLPDLGQPTLLMAFAPLATAAVGRIILVSVRGARKQPELDKPPPETPRASMHESLFPDPKPEAGSPERLTL